MAQEAVKLAYHHTCSSRFNALKRFFVKIGGRNRNCGILLAVALSLSACSTAMKPQELETESPTPHPTLIILGDSLMAQSYDGPRTTASSVIARDYDWYVVNISRPGATLAAAVRLEIWKAVQFIFGNAGWDSDARRKNSVVVQLAHNDWFWWQADSERFEKNYRKLLTGLSPLPTTVYCLVPLPAGWDYAGRVNGSNTSYEDIREVPRNLAAEGLCRLIETRDWYTEQDIMAGNAMPDQLHLNGEGHQIFARNLMKILRSDQTQQP